MCNPFVACKKNARKQRKSRKKKSKKENTDSELAKNGQQELNDNIHNNDSTNEEENIQVQWSLPINVADMDESIQEIITQEQRSLTPGENNISITNNILIF